MVTRGRLELLEGLAQCGSKVSATVDDSDDEDLLGIDAVNDAARTAVQLAMPAIPLWHPSAELRKLLEWLDGRDQALEEALGDVGRGLLGNVVVDGDEMSKRRRGADQVILMRGRSAS